MKLWYEFKTCLILDYLKTENIGILSLPWIQNLKYLVFPFLSTNKYWLNVYYKQDILIYPFLSFFSSLAPLYLFFSVRVVVQASLCHIRFLDTVKMIGVAPLPMTLLRKMGRMGESMGAILGAPSKHTNSC